MNIVRGKTFAEKHAEQTEKQNQDKREKKKETPAQRRKVAQLRKKIEDMNRDILKQIATGRPANTEIR